MTSMTALLLLLLSGLAGAKRISHRQTHHPRASELVTESIAKRIVHGHNEITKSAQKENGIFLKLFNFTGPPRITPEEELFQEIDKDGDGIISLKEFTALVKKLGTGSLSDVEIKKAFNEADTDGSGGLDVAEFTAMYNKSENEGEKILKDFFKRVDTDGDGIITKEQLTDEMHKLVAEEKTEEGKENVRREFAQHTLEEMDRRGDGTIRYVDFMKYFNPDGTYKLSDLKQAWAL
eukprot:gnl/MRDRNA2_/MRDRNA2_35838_c0_seq1.p1 gnl/MRDRNA2_/MRDRNA2_35838_c0~~gnl/MRDRNA2_/MRDRNA2_35838_c0_seq1.p1  ORF type:complete len:260 (+),score=64.84 gnl/MRDRNA2_/MRDRNA2_35838_c0_seq1:77-781(+)